jgi:hypothetical protein
MTREFSLELAGQLYTGPSASGPWRLHEPVLESRKRKEKPMPPSSRQASGLSEQDKIDALRHMGYEAAAQRRQQELLEEQQRRPLREASVELPVDLDDAEIDDICRQVKELLQSRRGEGGKGLTQLEACDRFRAMLDKAHEEPTEEDEALEEAFGIPSPRRHRSKISNEAFVTTLMNSPW